MELVGEFIGGDISRIPGLESAFNEFEEGEAHFYLSSPLSQMEIDRLDRTLREQGVVLTAPVTQDARTLLIRFRKEFGPMAVITIAVAAVIAVGTGILGWQVFKVTQLGIPIWAWIIGVTALVYLLFGPEAIKSAAKSTGRAGLRAAGAVGSAGLRVAETGLTHRVTREPAPKTVTREITVRPDRFNGRITEEGT